jgi:hypothetical protein
LLLPFGLLALAKQPSVAQQPEGKKQAPQGSKTHFADNKEGKS